MRSIEQPPSTRMAAEWARRYLQSLNEPRDRWEADYFRSGCNFLARDSTTGAIACWKSITLPIDRRRKLHLAV
ncbi:MAG: hypothetical protein ACRC44_09450, partial [Bifidobacterium asteroides]